MAGGVGIGVDINEHQVRVVKLRRTSRGLLLQGLGSAPTPREAMRGDVVVDPRLAGGAVRQAIQMAEARTASAVVGLPGRAAASRLLELPAMAPEEMQQVVAGEMEHHRVIPLDQGTFSFLLLGEPNEVSRRVRALVMAAERRVVDGAREALRAAGAGMAVLEPVALAACRSAAPQLAHGGVALLSLGARGCEFVVLNDGRLRYLRQLDVGALDLADTSEKGDADRSPEAEPQALVLLTHERPADGFQLLVFEIQRSLDFYHRETPEASRVERLVLCADPDLTPDLAARLEESLGLPVALCDPLEGIINDPSLDGETVRRVAPAFAPAIGLALRALGERPEAPAMDLSLTGPEGRIAKVAPRWLSRAFAFTAVALLAVVGATLLVDHALRARARELSAANVELARVTQEEQERTEALRRVQEAQRIVQVKGLPWSDILFRVSESTPPGVWLTEVSLNAGNVLTLKGGGASAGSVATLMESFARSSLFSGPQMSSIQKDSSAPSGLVKYEVKVIVAPPTPPSQSARAAPPPDAPVGAVFTAGGPS